MLSGLAVCRTGGLSDLVVFAELISKLESVLVAADLELCKHSYRMYFLNHQQQLFHLRSQLDIR